jgi:pantoate--beta-alanine ligase
MYRSGVKDLLDFPLDGLDTVMEGKYREGHFEGVVTIVDKFFALIEPDKAYFGLKDFQQLAIIRSMTKQLGMPIEIIGCPIVRESDGLAMSSRNVRLTEKERALAPLIYKTLHAVQQQAATHSIAQLKAFAENEIKNEATMSLEYFEISDANTLEPIHELKVQQTAVACIALKLGAVRLIDNVVIG